MAVNPIYYLHRHSDMVLAQCPSMTRERYMEGFDRANALINSMIGVANEVARIAISDAIDVIKKQGLFRQKTKQLCNETVRRQEAYEAKHNQDFGERLKLWLDYLDHTEDEYRKHIFNIYMAVKQLLDHHRQKDTELKARIECGYICAQLAVGQFDALMDDLKQKFGVDYSPLFQDGRYDKPLHTWKQLSAIYVKTDDPDDYINMNDDKNLRLAVDVLARKLNDGDVLNRLGKYAIDHNMEVARKYTDPKELEELEAAYQ